MLGFIIFNHIEEFRNYLPQLINQIATGQLHTEVDLGDNSPEGKFSGLEQAHRAEEWLHSGKNIGKVVLQIRDL